MLLVSWGLVEAQAEIESHGHGLKLKEDPVRYAQRQEVVEIQDEEQEPVLVNLLVTTTVT